MSHKVTVRLGENFEVEGVPFRMYDNGTLMVDGWTEEFDFDDQVIASFEDVAPDSFDEAFEIEITDEMLKEAKEYRDYITDPDGEWLE
jgi:hypothetical protein